MHQVAKVRRLAATAAHLCSAYDDLVAAGYDSWGEELRAVLEIIDAEIQWLASEKESAAAASR
ncbi:MAG TPA: hypothetical protein VHZ49_21830 [Methylomirabilota bacterium]|jgi:hypothetical protein|nr:hypothetical protein [Methylomirabilota bacterium]